MERRNWVFRSIGRKMAFLLTLATLAPLILALFITFTAMSASMLSTAIGGVADDARLHAGEISFAVAGFQKDVIFLAGVPPIQGIIRARSTGRDPLDNSTLEQWKQRLAAIFSNLATDGNYMQLRYLDEEGNELVRVDANSSAVWQVPDSMLQNKKDRYYFTRTMRLPPGTLFVSPLDLNREGSPPRVEVPHTSVMRYAVSVANAAGERKGMIIVNVFGSSILKTFSRNKKGAENALLDSRGFYLYHQNKSKRWGSPADLGTGENIRRDQKRAGDILSGQSGAFMSENHVIAYIPVPITRDVYWIVVEVAPTARVLAPLITAQTLIVSVAILSVLLLLATITYFTRSITRPVRKLGSVVRGFAKGNFSVRATIRTGDELEELGHAFNRAAESLSRIDQEHKQVDRAKTEFLSMTSHELRSPMTPMKAQLQMLNEGYFGKLNRKQRESIDIILSNAERLDKIVVDFLEISRIEAARLKFQFRKVNLEKTVHEVVDYMKGFMPEKKIKLSADSGRLPVIEADPDRVSQVLRNLVNNAIKFTPPGGAVKVGARALKDSILFTVSDTGAGISPKDQKRIFEPFYQAERTFSRKHGGTGLGLAICRGIVESQHGRLWVESVLGKGSVFRFTLPIIPTKEIKPIKLLFSSRPLMEKRLKEAFEEMLGPMGLPEFESMKGRLDAASLRHYITSLEQQGVMTHAQGNEFKKALENILKTPAKTRQHI